MKCLNIIHLKWICQKRDFTSTYFGTEWLSGTIVHCPEFHYFLTQISILKYSWQQSFSDSISPWNYQCINLTICILTQIPKLVRPDLAPQTGWFQRGRSHPTYSGFKWWVYRNSTCWRSTVILSNTFLSELYPQKNYTTGVWRTNASLQERIPQSGFKGFHAWSNCFSFWLTVHFIHKNTQQARIQILQNILRKNKFSQL